MSKEATFSPATAWKKKANVILSIGYFNEILPVPFVSKLWLEKYERRGNQEVRIPGRLWFIPRKPARPSGLRTGLKGSLKRGAESRWMWCGFRWCVFIMVDWRVFSMVGCFVKLHFKCSLLSPGCHVSPEDTISQGCLLRKSIEWLMQLREDVSWIQLFFPQLDTQKYFTAGAGAGTKTYFII